VIAADNDYEPANVKATFTVKAEIENPPQTLDLFDLDKTILWDETNLTNPRPNSYDVNLLVRIKPNADLPNSPIKRLSRPLILKLGLTPTCSLN